MSIHSSAIMRNPCRATSGQAVVAVCLLCFLLAGCKSSNSTARRDGGSGKVVWQASGFEALRQGTFDDAGAGAYVARDGSVQWIPRWDLNNDGNLDLVFANSHAQSEKLDAVVYFGNGQDFDSTRSVPIPSEGAQWFIPADFNGDGITDVVVPNYTNGTWSKMDSFVYFGGIPKAGGEWSAGPFEKRQKLPTEAAQHAAVADFNRDGHLDIVFALSAGNWEYRGGDALQSPCRIFFGGPDGFARDRNVDIEAAGASAVATADFNADGWPDLVIANRERAGKFDIDSFVYLGGEGGFSAERRIALPTRQANFVAAADVNGDGKPDIIFANGQGPVSFIYLNQGSGFDPAQRIELPTSEARGCAVGNVNADGRPDVFFTNFQTAGNPLTQSALYVNSETGFAPERRQMFETIGASGVTIADLNADGRPEVIVSNTQTHNSYDVHSYIFWNSADGLKPERRTSIATQGAVGNAVADFNGDGHADVLFNNTLGGGRGGVEPTFVYYGDAKGEFSVDRRTDLPSVEAYGWGTADLNNDGWPDLVIANQAETGRRVTENYIYWGGKDGFSPARRSSLVAEAAKAVNIADLDRDGWLDLVFCTAVADRTIVIFWGGGDGYASTRRTSLPAGATGAVSIADLTGDGHLDLLVGGGRTLPALIFPGDGTRDYSAARRIEIADSPRIHNVEIADMNADGHLDLLLLRRGLEESFIYYGDASNTFAPERRTSFTPIETQGVTVGDVNGDGWLDVVAPRYKDKGSRATMSRIYTGSREGISDERFFELPTNSGTGSQIADFNRDGFADLLLTCHRNEGNPDVAGAISEHVTDTFLYWGSASGFSPERKQLIPTRGAHYDSGYDMGSIGDRRLRTSFTLGPVQVGDVGRLRLETTVEARFGGSVRWEARSAGTPAELDWAIWQPIGQDGRLPATGGACLQLRGVMEGKNGASAVKILAIGLKSGV